jgi:hypothetical protein
MSGVLFKEVKRLSCEDREKFLNKLTKHVHPEGEVSIGDLFFYLVQENSGKAKAGQPYKLRWGVKGKVEYSTEEMLKAHPGKKFKLRDKTGYVFAEFCRLGKDFLSLVEEIFSSPHYKRLYEAVKEGKAESELLDPLIEFYKTFKERVYAFASNTPYEEYKGKSYARLNREDHLQLWTFGQLSKTLFPFTQSGIITCPQLEEVLKQLWPEQLSKLMDFVESKYRQAPPRAEKAFVKLEVDKDYQDLVNEVFRLITCDLVVYFYDVRNTAGYLISVADKAYSLAFLAPIKKHVQFFRNIRYDTQGYVTDYTALKADAYLSKKLIPRLIYLEEFLSHLEEIRKAYVTNPHVRLLLVPALLTLGVEPGGALRLSSGFLVQYTLSKILQQEGLHQLAFLLLSHREDVPGSPKTKRHASLPPTLQKILKEEEAGFAGFVLENWVREVFGKNSLSGRFKHLITGEERVLAIDSPEMVREVSAYLKLALTGELKRLL